MTKNKDKVTDIELPLDQMLPGDREYFVEQNVNPLRQNVNMKGRPVGNPPRPEDDNTRVVNNQKVENQNREVAKQMAYYDDEVEEYDSEGNYVKEADHQYDEDGREIKPNTTKGVGNTEITIEDREVSNGHSTPVNLTSKTYQEVPNPNPEVKTFVDGDDKPKEANKKTTDDKKTNATHTTQK